MTAPRITPEKFRAVYAQFNASISTRVDCGRKCAPLNNGSPVCCDTENAIPVMHRQEYKLLKSRTDLWKPFKPYDASSRKIVAELPDDTCAVACKGAAFCERDNRSIACRAFPFYPYIDKAGAVIGLAYYWGFEDRCWVLSNLGVVEKPFVLEMIAASEKIFKFDPEEYDTMKKYAASQRRVFSRWKRKIPLIGRDGGFFQVDPRNGRIKPAKPEDFAKHGPFKSEAAYKRTVKEYGGELGPEPKGGYLAP